MRTHRRPSLALTRLAIGADWSGTSLDLVALGMRLRRFVVIDALQLPEPSESAARGQVTDFLKRNQLQESRVMACLPREAVLVRFLDLPAEVEPQLTQVVGYQIGALHPFPEDQVAWDCAVTGRDPARKQISVVVALAEKSCLEEYKRRFNELGLRLSGLTLLATACAPLLKALLPERGLVVGGRGSGVELMSFEGGNLRATQEIPSDPGAGAGERLERALHGALATLPVLDSTEIPWFVFGAIPPAFRSSLSSAVELPAPKLKLQVLTDRFDASVQLGALAAAHAVLLRKVTPSINLLPKEERWQPQRTTRAPAYILGGTAALLAVTVGLHGWIEATLYGRALHREIQRLAAPAARVRAQAQQADGLAGRASVLEGIRAGDGQTLGVLEELTRLLPKDTWLQQLQITEDSVEIYGSSVRADDLVPPLEKSPYFAQVEFTSPITRDNQNREMFRIRMRLRTPVRP
jgi:Tfp pilus assembly protein PilN